MVTNIHETAYALYSKVLPNINLNVLKLLFQIAKIFTNIVIILLLIMPTPFQIYLYI